MSKETIFTYEADSKRRLATAQLDQSRRSELGQFLTPSNVACLMANMFSDLPKDIRLLDAGAGSGSLTAVVVRKICSQKESKVRSLTTTAFEIDDVLFNHLQDTLSECRSICKKAGIAFQHKLRKEDFIEASITSMDGKLFSTKPMSFNLAIMNPPYRKIATNSFERRLLKTVQLDATNLYVAFVALAIRLIEPGGQLVVIIPRSFCNGPYFRPFRKQLLAETSIPRIHVFNSRKDAFKEDGVLQENVILHLIKEKTSRDHICVSSSNSPEGPLKIVSLPFSDVVRSSNGSGDSFIHLPMDEKDNVIASWMEALPKDLESLGLTISTGRVVDFRAKTFLRDEPENGTVPLIYPCHFSNGIVKWPISSSKKPNAIVACEDSSSLLVPSGYYVLTKRFSSKEEAKRIVAVVYDPHFVKAEFIGFENHLNYFHRTGRGLEKEEAYGLATFLNSTVADKYFRQFNGHTQVNATDIRTFRFPTMETIIKIGKALIKRKLCNQQGIDRIVHKHHPISVKL